MKLAKWFLACCALAIAARWGSFFISVINHDESTYVVIADELLRGEVYFRDVVDTKPIGIFWVYAALIKLTGGSIVALRTAAACVVGLGAWGLSLVGWRATGSARVGRAAAVIYILICSLFTYYGVSPNTEIFFNVLTVFAVAVAVAPRVRPDGDDPMWHWPVAGLLLGLAVVIKPFAAAESLAVGLFLVWFYGRRRRWARLLAAGTALTAAFALPLLGVYLYYRHLGLLDALWFYTVEVSGAYPVDLPWYLRLKYMGDYLLRFSPFVVLGALTQVQWWRRWRGEEDGRVRWGLYLLLQFALVTGVVLLTGKRFGHYQVQLHPVLALLAACWWARGETSLPWLRGAARRARLRYLVPVAFLLLGAAHYANYAAKRDEARQIADYLRPRLAAGETFFAINGYQIAYHLLDRPVPTPYVHSSLLFLDHHVRAFRIDEVAEARRILADPTVTYLIKRDPDAGAAGPVTDLLLASFTEVDRIGDRLLVYRRR